MGTKDAGGIPLESRGSRESAVDYVGDHDLLPHTQWGGDEEAGRNDLEIGDGDDNADHHDPLPYIQENGDENRHDGVGNPLANPANEVGRVLENLASDFGVDGAPHDAQESGGDTNSRSQHVGETDQVTTSADDVAILLHTHHNLNGAHRSSPDAAVRDGDHTVSEVGANRMASAAGGTGSEVYVDRMESEVDATHRVSEVCVSRMANEVCVDHEENEA